MVEKWWKDFELFFKSLAFAGSVLLLSSAAASAATITANFNLRGTGGSGASYSFNKAGLGLTVTAYNQTAGVLGDSIDVVKRRSGLGARSAGERGGRIDGRGRDEMLVFSFDREVTIKRIFFSFLDADDKFTLASYDPGTLSLGQLASGLDISEWYRGNPAVNTAYDGGRKDFGKSRLTSAQKLIGSVFGIGATADDSEFMITRIKVSYEPQASVTPVPLPAAGWMFLAGLGALAGISRRRKKRA